jgi:hypothetical protein
MDGRLTPARIFCNKVYDAMKHTLDELLDIVYRYYPRGVGILDGDVDPELCTKTEEHARLVAARRQAATDERWRSLLARLYERFPNMVMNQSLHLPTGSMDACYSFTIYLPGSQLWSHVSFVAPYYITCSWRLIDVVKRVERVRVVLQGLQFYIRRSAIGPQFLANPDDELPQTATVKESDITFDLSPDEQPYAAWIAREIETTFGCEPMPPEVGTVFVPDLATPKLPGEVRLYDCLFSNHHQWVKPRPSEGRTGIELDPSRLSEPFTKELIVLAALYHIVWALFPPERQRGFWAIMVDGVLHKTELLEGLAKLRLHVESPKTLRAMAAARELEALVASWNGEGGPPDAMVAWASSFLLEWASQWHGRSAS